MTPNPGPPRAITSRVRRLSVTLSVLGLLVAGLLLVGEGPARAQGIAHYRHLPAQVFGPVAVGMPDERTVEVQHLDPATGRWDSPSVLLRTRHGVTCGALDGRASGPAGGVALLVECARPYYVDQAPTRSVALVSTDGRTWHRHRLPGESYLAPAVSPSATYAAWLTGGSGRYVEWSSGGGFAAPAATTYRYDSGGETVVVDDAGTVSVLGPEPAGRRCVVGVHTRDLSGARSHSTLPDVDPGCTEGSLQNVDAFTVLAGGDERAYQLTLTRSAPGAPWQLTAGAPVDAPGLVHYGYSGRRIPTHFLYSGTPGSPIVAIGSPDRHRVLVQLFDEATRTWGAQAQVLRSRATCEAGYTDPGPQGRRYVDVMLCGHRLVTVLSRDGVVWKVRKRRQR